MSTGYTLLDFGSGQRLERWATHTIVRPDPTCDGAAPARPEAWSDVDAAYEGATGQGRWVRYGDVPERWPTSFDDLSLITSLTPFKHTGVFPEQVQNWRWAREVGCGRCLQVLNLFAYTGGATVALTKDGHHVTHVDASRPALTWARENAELNAIGNDRIRWMPEDALVFAGRELRRGRRYDGVILDPPAYGHAPGGRAWRADRDLAPLLETCIDLLSDQPAFVILNAYAQHDTPDTLHRLLKGVFHTRRPELSGRLEASELTLSAEDGRSLSTGVVVRWRST